MYATLLLSKLILRNKSLKMILNVQGIAYTFISLQFFSLRRRKKDMVLFFAFISSLCDCTLIWHSVHWVNGITQFIHFQCVMETNSSNKSTFIQIKNFIEIVLHCYPVPLGLRILLDICFHFRFVSLCVFWL